jgi:hypothetical protein
MEGGCRSWWLGRWLSVLSWCLCCCWGFELKRSVCSRLKSRGLAWGVWRGSGAFHFPACWSPSQLRASATNAGRWGLAIDSDNLAKQGTPRTSTREVGGTSTKGQKRRSIRNRYRYQNYCSTLMHPGVLQLVHCIIGIIQNIERAATVSSGFDTQRLPSSRLLVLCR